MATLTVLPMKQELSKGLSSKSVILNLELRKPGIRRKVTGQKVEDADPEMVYVSKDIIKSEEYQAVKEVDGQIGRYVRTVCMPSPFKRGFHMLPLQLLEQADARLLELQTKRLGLVKVATGAYNLRKTAAPMDLGKLYNPADYPTLERFEAGFGMKVQYLSFETPKLLEEVRADIRQREEAQLEAQFAQYRTLWSQLLCEGMKKLVDHLVDRLTPEADGSRRTFHKTSLTNLYGFLETVQARNLGDNEELNRLADMARGLLADGELSPADLRGNDAMREAVRKGFEVISDRLDSMLERLSGREFSPAPEK